MAEISRQAAKSLPVRELALQLTHHLGSKDWTGEIATLHRFVRDNIRYIKDVRGVETVATPTRTLDYGQGDCDDQAVLLASLLESIGYKTRFVAIGTKSPFKFNHVYGEVEFNGQWITLETTEPVEIGWKPRNILAIMIQPV